MIEPNSKHLKTTPEKYFDIPKGEKVDVSILLIQLERIDTMIELLIESENEGAEQSLNIAFILEGMVYQAKELAFKMGEIK